MIQDETTPWSPQDALIAMMVAISVSDQNIKNIRTSFNRKNSQSFANFRTL